MTMSIGRPVIASGPSPANTCYFKPSLSEIQYGMMRFLITDRPSDHSINSFAEELGRHRARAVVRVCESSYPTEPLTSHGIDVIDWEFIDGSPPPPDVINKFLMLAKESFMMHPDQCIAVHCVAGLGRAPVLVAIALMEADMSCEDAVQLIRHHRRGALNQKQLDFLASYKPSGQLRKLRYTVDAKNPKNCSIM
ncbi:hypothetical protein QR680_018049 [Steinernema hermaphroditum]|uniref:protein-tyrosine-phosphatase n=1 Tax=Steinernema hermaphroditum TaxID=289476 RepID=A0AA39LQ44_9BILA|nr:hypothetical protein QR680_018049 [Steinernema hermaphroditum]